MRQTKRGTKRELNLLVTFTALVLFISMFYLFTEYGGVNITGFVTGNFYDNYNIYILNTYEGDQTSFVLPIENDNENAISEAYAEIEIYNSANEKITTLTTNTISLQPQQKAELKTFWEGKAGDYQARILVFLDEESYSFTKSFKLEKKTISFESILVNDFKLGEVANFDVLVQNHLAEPIENVSAGILIYSNTGKTLAEVRSARATLSPSTTTKLNTQWDTKNIPEGKYNAKLVIDYGENFIDRDIVLDVSSDTIEIVGMGYAVAQKPRESSSMTTIIAFLVILLVAVNITWIVIYRRKTKDNKN